MDEIEEREQQLLEAANRMRQAQAPVVVNMPTDVNDALDQMDSWNELHPVKPVTYTPLPKNELEQKPGIFEGIGHEWYDWSLTGGLIKDYQKSKAIAQSPINDLNPSKDIIPLNWNSMDNEDYYKQTSPKYWDLLRMSQGPGDQQARFNYAQDQMAKDAYYKNGSLIQKIISKGIGIPAGFLIDLPTLIPWAQSMKYAKLSENILYNAPKDWALVAGITGADEALKYGIDPDLSMKDAGNAVLFNSIAGMAMLGGARGLTAGWEGYKMKRALPKALELNSEGIGGTYQVNAKGDITDVNAAISNSDALSADKVSNADLFYGSQLSKTGLFWFPKVGNIFKPISPIFKGLSSESPVINHYTNVMTSHGINTINGKKYVPNQQSFQDKMYAMQGDAQQFGVYTEGLRKSYNGIDLSLDEMESLKHLGSSFKKTDPADPASFGYQVANSIILQETHQTPQVNEAKTMYEDFTNKYSNRYLKAFGKNENMYNMWNDEGYFGRVYNRESISRNKQEFIDWGTNEITELDSMIADVERPLREAEESIALHEKQILNGVEIESHRQMLEDAKELKKLAIESIQENIETRPELSILLDEPHYLNREDRSGLKNFMKPLEKVQKELADTKALLSAVKGQYSKVKSKITKPSKKKTEAAVKKEYDTLRAKLDELEAQIKQHQKTTAQHEQKILDLQSDMAGKAQAKEIPDTWYYKHPDTGFIHFREYNKPPKFRPLYRDLEHKQDEMNGLWESLMNLSDDELATKFMNNFTGVAENNPNRARSVMLRTKSLLSGGWLKTDLPGMAHNYAMTVGKAAAREESLSQFKTRYGTSTGIDGVFKAMRDDHKARLNKLQKLPPEKRKKAIQKENRQYAKDRRFIERFDDALMGVKSNDREVEQYTTILKNLAAGYKLGFTFLSQGTDTAGIVFKNGPLAFVRDGFLPAIKSINGLIKSESGKRYRAYASEAHLGFEGYRTNMTKKYYGSDSYNSITPNSSAAKYISQYANSFAHATSKLTGMDFIENFNRFQTANVVQSRIMKWMAQAEKGNLSSNNRQKLSMLGIEADEWAAEFNKEFKTHGRKGIAGGYQSYYYNWANTQAKNKMGNAINMAVNGTIIKRQVGNEPFVFSNPIISMVTQFMGWGFSSFNRYTLPMLQKADANMVIGTMGLGMMSVLEEASRKWARGEEVDLDSDEMLIAAFSNSAPFVMPYKAAMLANTFIESDTLNKLKNDKHKNIFQLGLVGGPAFGFVKDFATAVHMFGSGKFNQDGFKKATKMIPGTQWWWTYRMADMLRESFTDGLPKTKQNAPGYWE
jgi:hypothetical protein